MKLFFVVLSLLWAQLASAQFYGGFSGGLSRNTLHTDISNRPSTHMEAASGYTINLFFQYRFNTWAGLQAGPELIQKKYAMVRTGDFAGIYETFSNTYLQLPLMAHLTWGARRLKGFLHPGVYAAYWMYGRVKGVTPNILDMNSGNSTFYSAYYNEPHSFDTERDNRFEFGWLAGAGISYALGNRYIVFAEGRYYYALTDIQKQYMARQTSAYNQTYTWSIGCLLPLFKKQ